MATILWIIAAILVISGIFAIFRKQLLWGIVLIVVGLLVGPGGEIGRCRRSRVSRR